jgi:hypothetical protein
MTTIAYHQYCNIPYIGGSNVSYPIRPKCSKASLYGKPLYHTAPCAMFQRNSAFGLGKHSNPVQFQSGDNSSSFAAMRSQYTSNKNVNNNYNYNDFKKKTFTQMPYSLYLAQQKATSVGKTSISESGLLTYKSFDKNVTKNALQRIRSASCVAPAKKGSIQY